MQEGTSFIQFLIRHWRFSALVVAVSIGVAGLVTVMIPKKYESHIKFLVNNERTDLVITPEKERSSNPPAEVTETQVNTEIELLKSRNLLESLVHSQHLYGAYRFDDRKLITKAVERLRKNLNIQLVRKTNIIDVSFRAESPELSSALLAEMGDKYLAEHLRVHSAPGTEQFFVDQVEKYGEQLSRARVALSTFHQRTSLFSLPVQQTAELNDLSSVDSQLRDTQAKLTEEEARLAQGRQALPDLPERVVTQIKREPNQTAEEHLETIIADLENRRFDLIQKFKPSDRFVQTIDAQLIAARQHLSQVKSEGATEETTDLGSLRLNTQANIVAGELSTTALRARRNQLVEARKSIVARLVGMDSNLGTLENLEQYEKQALENYTLYAHRLDEVRLAESLDASRFTNVVLIEKPVSSPVPVSPRLLLNILLGFAAGICILLGFALTREDEIGTQSSFSHLRVAMPIETPLQSSQA